MRDHIAVYGYWCPLCGSTGVVLTADHLFPVSLGYGEDGPLSVHCVKCQKKQGGSVGNLVKSRTR